MIWKRRIFAALLTIMVIASLGCVCNAAEKSGPVEKGKVVLSDGVKAAEKSAVRELSKTKVAPLSEQAAIVLEDLRKGIKKSIPEVAGAVGRAIFWRNLAMLVKDLILAVILIVFGVHYVRKILPKFWEWAQDCEYESGGFSYIIFALVGVALPLWVGVEFFAGTNLLDPRCWMGVFDQKAYLANLVLENMKLLPR